jgi:hypothetical protein
MIFYKAYKGPDGQYYPVHDVNGNMIPLGSEADIRSYEISRLERRIEELEIVVAAGNEDASS